MGPSDQNVEVKEFCHDTFGSPQKSRPNADANRKPPIAVTMLFIAVFGSLCQLASRRLVLCSLISLQVVRSFAIIPFFSKRSLSNAFAASTMAGDTIISTMDDPYSWLEQVESEESLQFAKDANEACLNALGDPTKSDTGTYDRVLSVLESDDRIPYVSKYGWDDDGNQVLVNFWQDSKNPKGIWRRTTMDSYCTKNPEWKTMLDVDELAKKDDISWVWKGATPLPRARDPLSEGGRKVTRALLHLSRGGSDATHVKEFDMVTGDFVSEDPFILPEAKSRVSYRSRDVLTVGTDFGPDSLTDSGYPRTVREWVRGTDLEDAPVVFEGDKKDVSVGVYIDDQRENNGGIYEIRCRSLTFYTSKYWARKIQYEHLLAPDDPARVAAPEPHDFVEVDIQEDAEIDFVGNLIIISLRSDWEPVPGQQKFKQGSLIYTDAETFFENGKGGCEFKILFEPTERTAEDSFTLTKNYLILSIMDNVKSKLQFFKVGEDGNSLTLVGEDKEAVIRSANASPLDRVESDQFWFTTSGFTQPSTLCLANASKIESPESREKAEIYVEREVKSLPDQYDSAGLEVTQRVAISKDGTEIPYFLICKKDVVLDGTVPTLLYGYGGFEVSLTPRYVASSGLAWLERGGAYVEANIRGGGEFGPKWHQAALKENRNKAYEDFIAVAEDLIDSGLCKPETLAIRGGSNGGLLMGNMYTMRPDLFGAIHCAVPLLDMQRYHKLLAGASWMAEYGDPDTDDWKFLKQYSPYHNIDEKCKKYPDLLVTTSTRDDRVHPAHARKMVKKLWDMGKGKDWPVYYYENIEGGHGGAADAKQSAFMTSLAYDFMWDTLTGKKK